MPFDGGWPNIGVIGAGLSGLRAVDTIQKLVKEYKLPDPEITIFEAASAPCGRAKSFMLDGVIINKGANCKKRRIKNPFFNFC